MVYAIAIGALSFLGGLAGGYFRGYMGAKGKNRADKEDLGNLTRIVEDIKDANSRGLAELTESMRAHHSMRSAALDKRLEVHQDAYRMSMRMFQMLFVEPKEHGEVSSEIRDWWANNALYLDAEPRAAFYAAWSAFVRHPILNHPDFPGGPDRVVDNIKIIDALAPALEKAASLPPIRLDREIQLGALDGAVPDGDRNEA